MSDRPATVTSKMQLTIPKAIVQALGLQRGDKLVFTVQGKRLIGGPLTKRKKSYAKPSAPLVQRALT